MLKYTGTVKLKKETRQVSEKFKTREFVLTDNASTYPQTILFQLTQDRCSLIDNIKIGDEVTVLFGLKGREWQNPQGEVKYFNSLDVFKIEKHKSNKQEERETGESRETFIPDSNGGDDLPF